MVVTQVVGLECVESVPGFVQQRSDVVVLSDHVPEDERRPAGLERCAECARPFAFPVGEVDHPVLAQPLEILPDPRIDPGENYPGPVEQFGLVLESLDRFGVDGISLLVEVEIPGPDRIDAWAAAFDPTMPRY
jgi:hypothetical protein